MEAVFILLEFRSPSRRIFIGSHSLPPLWFAVSVLQLVRPPGVEKTSRLRSRDQVASGVKRGPHGGMNNKMKSWTVSWLSLKTKVELGLRGS
jgi:hypothetical protein